MNTSPLASHYNTVFRDVKHLVTRITIHCVILTYRLKNSDLLFAFRERGKPFTNRQTRYGATYFSPRRALLYGKPNHIGLPAIVLLRCKPEAASPGA